MFTLCKKQCIIVTTMTTHLQIKV